MNQSQNTPNSFFSGGIEYSSSPLPGVVTGSVSGITATFVGNLMENALFPPNLPLVMQGNGGALIASYSLTSDYAKSGGVHGYNNPGDSSQFYSVEGIRNSARTFSAVRNVFGQFRVTPDMAADPYRMQFGDVVELYCLMDFGYGTVDLSDMKIGNTPLSYYNDIDWKLWHNYTNERPDLYRNDHVTDVYNQEINTTFVTRRAPAKETNSIFLRINFPRGLMFTDQNNNPATAGARFTVQFRRNEGSWQGFSAVARTTPSHGIRYIGNDEFVLEGKRSDPFDLWMRFEMRSGGTWDIRIRRTNTPLYDQPENSWMKSAQDESRLTEVGSVTFRPPLHFDTYHSIVEFRIFGSDQVGGTLDNFSAIARRRLPVWDGTQWEEKFTRNPAWIAVEILRGAANPRPIPDHRIDLERFKEWADWCDEPSAQGDTRFTCDANFDAMSTVQERLLSVMQSARASLSIRNGKYSVIWENWPTEPVQVFTPANSWGFTGERFWYKPVDGLRVEWIDPELDYQKTELIVYADGKDETNAQHFESISCPYCTRYEQAYRDGRYFLAVGRLRPEIFTLVTDIESLLCERGDLVRVQHDVPRIGGRSSRITALNGAEISLSSREPLIWESTSDWEMVIRYSDATSEKFTVVGQTDPYTVVLDREPVKAADGDLTIYGRKDATDQLFLIKSIVPGEELTATITLVPYSPEIQYADTEPIPPYEPPIDDDIWYPSCMQDIEVNVNFEYIDRYPTANVEITWPSKAYAVHYEVYVSDDGGNTYRFHELSRSNSYLFWENKSTISANYPDQDVFLKILPVSAFGTKPGLDSCNPISFTPPVDTTPPAKPLFFAGNVTGTVINLSWLPPDEPDIGGYILRYSPLLTGAEWENATTERELIAYDIFSVSVNVRIGTYMLKTIDTSGNVSAEYSIVRTTIPELDGLNVFRVIDEAPAFTGNKVHTVLSGSELRLEEINPGNCDFRQWGTYDFDARNLIDVGSIQNVYLRAEVEFEGYDCGGNGNEAESNVVVQVKVATDLTAVIADWVPNMAIADPIAQTGHANDWSGWQTLTAGNYTGRYFQFRAVLLSFNQEVTPVVSHLSVLIDMPDRIEAGHDIQIAAGGTRVLFPGGPFMEPPTIATTHDNVDSPQDYLKIGNITEDGFDAEIFDNAHSSKAGQIDYIAKGYGAVKPALMPAVLNTEDDDVSMLHDAVHRPVTPIILR